MRRTKDETAEAGRAAGRRAIPGRSLKHIDNGNCSCCVVADCSNIDQLVAMIATITLHMSSARDLLRLSWMPSYRFAGVVVSV